MSKTAAAVKKRVGRPPHDVSPPKPMPWESKAFAKRVDDILNSIEVPQVDAEVRRYFQRTLYLSDHFGGGGREKIILLTRTILESEGNGDAALIEPVVRAVSLSMRPEWTDLGLAWIEAFDKIKLTELLQTMRGLDLFRESSLGHYLGISLRNKLWPILEPLVSKPVAARTKRKPATKLAKRQPPEQPAPPIAAQFQTNNGKSRLADPIPDGPVSRPTSHAKPTAPFDIGGQYHGKNNKAAAA